MSTENNENSENTMLDTLSCEKITRFLAPQRRRDVFDALAATRELSQGDLAKIVSSTATALSNQLSKFDKFEYKLLEAQNVGKFRYYRLSKCGRAYLETICQNTGCEPEYKSKSADNMLLQEAERSIQEFKDLYADKWKSYFNRVLVRLVNGRGNHLDEKGEMLVKRYLRCVELLSLEGDHEVLSLVLEVMSDDILRDDMEEFMEYFEPFVAVLNVLECEKNVFEVYMLVKTAFCGGEEIGIDDYVRAVKWNGGEYNKLKDTARKLIECVSGYSEEDIYRYFSYLLPDQAQLSMYIARCICGAR